MEYIDPNFAKDPPLGDDEVTKVCKDIANSCHLKRCSTCGRNRSLHHYVPETQEQCTPCAKTWTPMGIIYQGERLKVVHGKTPVRLLGVHHNMWLDAKARHVIDSEIEVAAHLYKNDNLRIDQRLKVTISMCLPSLFSFSAPLIDWSETDHKLLTSI